MRTTLSPTRCVRRQPVTSPSPARHSANVAWARAFVRQPTRSPEHARHQLIVADLLAQVEVTR